MNEANPKFFNIILGAGFSKAMAELPISKEIDELIFQDSSRLKELYNYLKGKDEKHNFETIIHELRSYKTCENIRNFFHKELSAEKSDELVQELTKKTSEVLTSTLDIKYEKIKKELSPLFIQFLELLVGNSFHINIFDLNFDNVFESTIQNSNLKNHYYDFYDFHTEGFKCPYFNYPLASLIINPFTINSKTYQKQCYREYANGFFNKELTSEKIDKDLNNLNNRRIHHYKLHGSLYEYYGCGETERKRSLLFKDKVSSTQVGAERFYITGGNKFNYLRDYHTKHLFKILQIYSPFDTLTIGYSFNDLHVECMADITISARNQSKEGFSPIQFFWQNRPGKYNTGELINKINGLIENNNRRDFYLEQFLKEITLNDQREIK